MKNIVVLISGSGSNLQAIIDACQDSTIKNANVVAVLSNKADAYGLERAKNAGIQAINLIVADYDNRDAYDKAMIEQIDLFKPDLVILAGYMRILSGEFVRHFQGKLLNIHPSLLPKYPGLHTHQRALDAGDKEHGTSVHFVTEELDGGPVILQAKVPIFAEDTIEDITARVQLQEHRIYPLVTNWFLQQRLNMENDKAVLDGHTLSSHGYAADE